MTDEALDAERLEEIARGFEGYPTPVDHWGKCWFCNGGFGHGPHGHAESCIWVHRDDLGEGVAALRARLEAAEQGEAKAWRCYANAETVNRELAEHLAKTERKLAAAEQEREQTFQSWLRWGLALREVLDLALRRAHRQIIEKVRNVLGGVEDPSASYAAALAEERARSVRLAELLRGAVCDERCDGGEHMDFCHTVFAALAEHDAARERRLVGG